MKIIQPINSPLCHFVRDENGATAIEYAMIAAGIAVAVAGTVMSLGSKVSGLFQSVQSAWPS
jgi:pilus assembly protein Flp/PilA